MDKNYISSEDALVPDRNKSLTGTFVDVVPVGEFNPAYQAVDYNSAPDLTTPCGVCGAPVIIDRFDHGTFHLCEDCRKAILFLKYTWHEIDELICKSHR